MREVDIRPSNAYNVFCSGRGGEIGRRARLRGVWIKLHTGSSPVLGTIQNYFPRTDSYNPVNPKQIAGARAATYIQSGMTVGLGTGSTAAYAVLAIGERVRNEALQIRCIATSDSTAALAKEQGIELVGWESVQRFDITIDGADEVDPQFRMIKGGGGALLREKIVASLTDTEIIIVDSRKVVSALGAFALPLAVIPFGWQAVQRRIEDKYNRLAPARLKADGSIYLTDENFVILDVAFGAPMPDPDLLEPALKCIPGVAEVGLFLGLCSRLIIGHDDGRIEERNAYPAP